MRVTVLGAGVVGVVTAWYLARRGHDVTVIDRAKRVASGTSFANAGQLSYSFTDALGRPAFLRHLPALLLNRDPAVRFRAAPRPDFLRWGLAFLRECSAARARANTAAVLRLALRSSTLMEELLAEAPLEFAYRPAGKLVLLSSRAELAAARASAELKRRHGCSTEILSAQEARDVEPALSRMEDDFIAAVHARGDCVADACAFTEALARWLGQNTSTQFRLGERALSVMTRDGAARGVELGNGTCTADAIVVCLGCDSAALLRPLGIVLPICPVRGYSVTLPASPAAPSASITHMKHRVVFSRIGPHTRIAGFADFVGRDASQDPARITALMRLARRIAPAAAVYDTDDPQAWGGFRPMTPDSRPRYGPTNVRGLYLNTGHGMLGWTLACATGEAVARAVDAA